MLSWRCHVTEGVNTQAGACGPAAQRENSREHPTISSQGVRVSHCVSCQPRLDNFGRHCRPNDRRGGCGMPWALFAAGVALRRCEAAVGCCLAAAKTAAQLSRAAPQWLCRCHRRTWLPRNRGRRLALRPSVVRPSPVPIRILAPGSEAKACPARHLEENECARIVDCVHRCRRVNDWPGTVCIKWVHDAVGRMSQGLAHAKRSPTPSKDLCRQRHPHDPAGATTRSAEVQVVASQTPRMMASASSGSLGQLALWWCELLRRSYMYSCNEGGTR